MDATSKVPFGIDGLDDVLRGGLPRGRLFLLKGNPGVGKTTLALQFLLEGARAGERGLYITLSETTEELSDVAGSHGWSLDGLALYELKAADVQHLTETQYTMYQPSEIELSEAMRTLLEEVERVKPDRVVFDSLSEIRLLASQALRYRRQILALKNYFADKKCTVLLLDDHSGQESDQHVESLVHGVLALERHVPVYGGTRRRLEISKLRGVSYRDGFHDYVLERGGLRVFPRLIAAEHRPGFQHERVPSGVSALDELLGDGLDRGTATLVVGPAGSGKSSLAAQYCVSAAERGEHAAVFAFDEGLPTLFARAESLGMPLRKHLESGRIVVRQVDPVEISPGQLAHEMRVAVEREHARVVVLDSLTGYLNAMPDDKYLLPQLHELLAYLAQNGIVTILVATQHGLVGNMTSQVDASYLADSVILLRYYEAMGSVRNAISVVKKRSGAHERTIREFSLGSGGITIGKPLRDFHGVLTGIPTYTGKAEVQARDEGGDRS
ncbi:MAG: ATPase domain-containing protein [Polyangiaceae bacterium]|jgi:circadian clock protein KaiC